MLNENADSRRKSLNPAYKLIHKLNFEEVSNSNRKE